MMLNPQGLDCLLANPAARVRLVCFPHAGGSISAFRRWPARLAPDVEVWGASLPGRAGRRHEPFSPDWDRLVDSFATAVNELVPRPLALFGHSLGAALAFEVARALARGGHEPDHLVVSARCAPQGTTPQQVPVSDHELVDDVERRYAGGIPPAVRGSSELMAHLLPMLRADLELSATHRYHPSRTLSCPITVLAGNGDVSVPRPSLEGWAELTRGPSVTQILPGGHFFLNDQEDTVLNLLIHRLTAPAQRYATDGVA